MASQHCVACAIQESPRRRKRFPNPSAVVEKAEGYPPIAAVFNERNVPRVWVVFGELYSRNQIKISRVYWLTRFNRPCRPDGSYRLNLFIESHFRREPWIEDNLSCL